jgi:hypothetical protein
MNGQSRDPENLSIVPDAEFTVACWNILYDSANYFKVPSQSQRLSSIVQTLKKLEPRPDIFGLLEVEHNENDGNLGERIATEVSSGSMKWVGHKGNNKQDEEMIGVFGKGVGKVETYTITNGRTLVIASTRNISVALAHLTYNPFGEQLRCSQVEDILAILGNTQKAVLMGDFNSASWQKSRRLIEKAGFVSVFKELGIKKPSTVLSEPYRKNLSLFYKAVTKWGFTPDDIYVRKVHVIKAGVFEGSSDHRGVWAQLSY